MQFALHSGTKNPKTEHVSFRKFARKLREILKLYWQISKRLYSRKMFHCAELSVHFFPRASHLPTKASHIPKKVSLICGSGPFLHANFLLAILT